MQNLTTFARDRTLSDKEIDEAVILVTDAINTAPRRLIKVDEFVYNKLPQGIMLLMKIRQIWRRNLKSNFHKYGNKVSAEDKALLSWIIRQMVAQFRNKKLTRKLVDIKPGPDMFQHINRLTGKNKFGSFVLIRNRDAIKAQVLAGTFESQLNTSQAN